MKIKVDGKYVEDFEFVKNFVCAQCDCAQKVLMDYKSSNNAIQARCGACNAYYGNFKYDDSFGGADNAAQAVSN